MTSFDTPTVNRIDPDAALLACTTLDRVDHVDAHLIHSRPASSRSPEQWAREILENVSKTRQLSLRAGWTMLGLKLHIGDADAIAGWPIAHRDADYLRLRGDSLSGLTGELVTRVAGDGVAFATFVQLDGPVARLLWSRTVSLHLNIVRQLLTEAAERTG